MPRLGISTFCIDWLIDMYAVCVHVCRTLYQSISLDIMLRDSNSSLLAPSSRKSFHKVFLPLLVISACVAWCIRSGFMQRRRMHSIIGPATKWVRPKGLRAWGSWGGGCTHQLGGLEECCKLPQRVRAKPGWQVILRQFQVKKAGLVIIPFHEFVRNNYYYLNKWLPD